MFNAIDDKNKRGAGDATGGDDPGTPPHVESYLAKNTGPILAILTVLLTFGMFYYFVDLTCRPSKESVESHRIGLALSDVESRFAQFSSAKPGSAEAVRRDELRRERGKLRTLNVVATEAAADAKERRGMVKDFVLYILGVLSSALTTIFGYYFGSSKGSSDKTSALSGIASKATPRQPTVATPGKHPGDESSNAAG